MVVLMHNYKFTMSVYFCFSFIEFILKTDMLL